MAGKSTWLSHPQIVKNIKTTTTTHHLYFEGEPNPTSIRDRQIKDTRVAVFIRFLILFDI